MRSTISEAPSRVASGLVVALLLVFPARSQSEEALSPDDPITARGWFPELFVADAVTRPTRASVRVISGHAVSEGEASIELFHESRAGILDRLWIENPAATDEIAFRFDGEEEPRLLLSGEKLFAGDSFPFLAPFAVGPPGAGGLLQIPLAFSRELRVTAKGSPGRFTASLRSSPSGERLVSFDRSALDLHAADVLDAVNALRTRRLGRGPGGEDLDDLTLARTEGMGPSGEKPYEIRPGEQKTVFRWRGPGVVRKILLRVRGNDEPLRTLLLQAFWDGWPEPCVSSPVGDFFLTGLGKVEGGGLVSGYREGTDVFYCRWPMPFRTEAEIRIVNEGDRTVFVDVAVETGVNDDILERSLYFHAVYRMADPSRDEMELLAYRGVGHLVGSNVSVVLAKGAAESRPPFSGGMSLLVDGAETMGEVGVPLASELGAELGVGTAFSLPFHGAPIRGEESFAAYRHRLTDRVPFRQVVRLRMLRGEGEAPITQAAACTFFYAQGEEVQEGEDLKTTFQTRDLGRTVVVGKRRVGLGSAGGSERTTRQGIEAHLLPVVMIRGGITVQESILLPGVGFSSDDVLLFRGKGVGSYVDLDLTMKKAGDYRIQVWPARGPAMATWTLAVDGTMSGEPYPAYAPEIESPDRQDFGVVTLSVGPHRIRLTVLSRDERSKGHDIALDLLTIVPVTRSRAQ